MEKTQKVEARTLHNLHKVDTLPGQIGVTVRKGRKWADVEAGDIISICECLPTPDDHNTIGTAEVEEVFVGVFEEIPAKLIQYEHEEASRSYNGLLASMRRAYGPEFSELEEVTVLTYLRSF